MSGGVQGVPGGGPDLSGTVWLAYYAATSRILCRRFQWAKWLRVPPFGACRGPPGKGEVKLPKFPTRHSRVSGLVEIPVMKI